MDLSSEEVMMLRLVKEATARGLIVAQDYQTREVMLLAATGEMHIHREVSVVRAHVPALVGLAVRLALEPFRPCLPWCQALSPSQLIR